MSVEAIGGTVRVSPTIGVARAGGASLDQVSSTGPVAASATSSGVSLADVGKYVGMVQNQPTVRTDRVEMMKAAVMQGNYGAMLERLAEKLAGFAES